MYRFLLTPRWLGLAVAAAVLAGAGVQLGSWQFDRRAERLADNARIEANLATRPVPLGSLDLEGSERIGDELEWRSVTVAGRYDEQGQLIVRNQSRDAGPGVTVLTPLRAADGGSVLVERGWLSTAGGTSAIPDTGSPPAGPVRVTGWLRADSAAGDSATVPVDGTVRAVASEQVAQWLGYPLLPGHVALTQQDPDQDGALSGPERPDLGEGPHFFYGLQWWFFGLLAPVGYAWFAYAEAHPRHRPRTPGLANSSSDAQAGVD
ncbi:MAG: SURF1 family protein [Actinomycetota bacterium]|nr:SURF1 family protein [Actinomycetota bacterium]